MNLMEILLILIVALIVIGPKQLPAVARTVGQYWQKIRGLLDHVKTEFDQEMKLDQLQRNVERAEAAEKKTHAEQPHE